MDLVIGTAGLLCVLLGVGHATLGLLWVLPGLNDEHLSATPFGGRSFTAATIHASWHIITVFALASGAILLWLAWDATADAKTVVLRVFAASWLTVAVVASWAGLRRGGRVRDLLRLPVPVFFVLVGVLCWIGST